VSEASSVAALPKVVVSAETHRETDGPSLTEPMVMPLPEEGRGSPANTVWKVSSTSSPTRRTESEWRTPTTAPRAHPVPGPAVQPSFPVRSSGLPPQPFRSSAHGSWICNGWATRCPGRWIPRRTPSSLLASPDDLLRKMMSAVRGSGSEVRAAPEELEERLAGWRRRHVRWPEAMACYLFNC